MYNITYQKQTRLHSPENNIFGNCMMTCYANILGIDVESCPRIEYLFDYKCHDEKTTFWWDVVQHFLSKYGYGSRIIQVGEESKLPVDEFYFVIGKTNRFDGKVNHMVIYRNGELFFDPHPTGLGLIDIVEYEIILKL